MSVNNESVQICIVLRASLNVLWFFHHSGSFQNRTTGYHIFSFAGVSDCKQLLDEVFVISRIIKVEVGVRLRLITLTETLIILDITKTECNNCFIIH